jgi:HD-GYP domain-containing protein (c-di-GMP phosphodiesterase class II)
MFSILQILRKHQDEKIKLKEASAASQAQDTKPCSQEIVQAQPQATAVPAEVNVSVFAAVNREIEDERLNRVREFYAVSVAWAKKIYSLELKNADEFKSQFLPFVSQAVDVYSVNDKDFLYQCLHDYEPAEAYYFYHAVNVAYISLELGRGMNYTPSRLGELFCGAFLHDIGIIPYIGVIGQAKALTPEEYSEVKKHPEKGLEMINQLGGEFSPGLIDIITQEHERMDGSGYPMGLREGQITEFAQIVALADSYEAMTHTRPHRMKRTPPKAVNEILNQKALFGMKFLKLLLERIGIFPVGTWVRLNTKEMGVVSKNNQGLPLRPAVQVLFAENGSKLLQPKTVDLASNLLISVEECLESQHKPR